MKDTEQQISSTIKVKKNIKGERLFLDFVFTMADIPMHPKAMTKLPDQAAYGPGTQGHVKRKSTVTIPPIQGSSFRPNGQRVIQIMLPKNGFLNGNNSFLQFYHKTPGGSLTPANTSANGTDKEASALSSSASNWIQRLRIKVGGRPVEDIDDYNILHEIFRKSVVSDAFTKSVQGIAEGYEGMEAVKMIETNLGLTTASLVGATPCTRTKTCTGVLVNANRTGNPESSFAQSVGDSFYPGDATHTLQAWGLTGKQYQVMLLSGFLANGKYLPLRFMPPVEIEITLCDFQRSHVWAPARLASTDATYGDPGSSNVNAGTIGSRGDCAFIPNTANSSSYRYRASATAGCPSSEQTYEISAVNYIAEVCEFDETFYQAFEQTLSQGVTIPYTTFTNHVFSHTGSTTDFQVAERVRSAKNILAVMRLNGDIAQAQYPKFVFSKNNLTQYQVKIGTQYFPMQPVDVQVTGDPYSGTRLMELMKVVSAMADVTNSMWTDAGNYSEAFIIGVDLDREVNRLSGLDTTKGLPLFISMRHNTSGVPCTFNVFVNYDMFVDLFPGEVIEVLN
jgi:hypothetical protein